ncbi:PUA-like domain-containing protein [Annulohypoxylon truncatum]|uniref:PUA-like domain-containing protein n=1 Tax=Annulohypoxylon truncatum TaxID=327061 RepID=UPI0020083031|nr:PUA-like domain-containing protein [Annulohypoxylon truncatum]KAI1204865.1 PUA-like domain-containing protein [Annulohypoxylon truncatum]
MSPQFELNADIRRMTSMPFVLHWRSQQVPNAPGAIEPLMNGYEANADEAVADATVANVRNLPEAVVDSTSNEVPVAQDEAISPIFREGGILHGIMVLRGATGRKTYRLDPNVPKKPSKIHGHNNIAVGTWFANRLVALQRGAHGSSMAGICGNVGAGAYSIVVSDNYADLDEDQGDVLFYSGSNSHSNLDPTRPAPSTANTKALKASLNTRRPVRVLRSGKARSGNHWAPECGLRYDGLYRIVALRERVNSKGGLYEQFVLHREPNQTPLETLRRTSPTAQEKRDLAEFQRG